MIKLTTKQVIEVGDWDEFVEETYGRRYSFQQQDGCKSRGNGGIDVPEEDFFDFENDSIPEIVNGEQMGVSFSAWLKRDPKQKMENQKYDFELDLWWRRNFYPDVSMIINDLHSRGLLPAGKYVINIDW